MLVVENFLINRFSSDFFFFKRWVVDALLFVEQFSVLNFSNIKVKGGEKGKGISSSIERDFPYIIQQPFIFHSYRLCFAHCINMEYAEKSRIICDSEKMLLSAYRYR